MSSSCTKPPFAAPKSRLGVPSSLAVSAEPMSFLSRVAQALLHAFTVGARGRTRARRVAYGRVIQETSPALVALAVDCGQEWCAFHVWHSGGAAASLCMQVCRH